MNDGLAYTLRRVTPADAQLLYVFLRCLSDRTRRLRFMARRAFSAELAQAEVARMVAGSADGYITLIVTKTSGAEEAAVAVAELACDHRGDTGEFAVVVRDDAQRKGIGSVLLRRLVRIAQEIGLTHLHADMLAENYPMQRLVHAIGLPYTTTIHAGQMQLLASIKST